ncbi:hypothetical protein [Aurantimonas sp. Leaf443]|uniref:hypothetical protein n=1 Tax=Aurantimonas sp. Leaf443 TaxID=1736378 RepID=UPI0006F30521|nr:hypothetical protein [Aurantimonas sp. Leaf443]KQT85534.1 hypothetical protein ASG48_10000 [Aurantimonas sp. Leaf443]
MSWSDRGRRRSALFAAFALAGLAGCTSGPLYGSNGPMSAGAPGAPETSMNALRGRFAVADVNDRTTQIVRNALLFRLNGGTTASNPLYEVRLTAFGASGNTQIAPGGVPSASIYRLNASYSVVRLSDKVVIGRGQRSTATPYDRTSQLYAVSRAVLDARQQAGDEIAAEIELAIAADLRRPRPGAAGAALAPLLQPEDVTGRITAGSTYRTR